jgi:hypothetical protein
VNTAFVVPDPYHLGLIPSGPEANRRDSPRKGQIGNRIRSRRIFEPYPRAQMGIKESQSGLSLSQLLFVTARSQTINFGSIPVFTKETKTFIVENGFE